MNYNTFTSRVSVFGWALLLILLFGACNDAQSKADKSSHNFVVLLDLSDRLLTGRQAETDIAAINVVFDSFLKQVSGNMIINSKDKFSIRILPQDENPLDVDSLNNLLMLDMSLINAIERKKKLLTFQKRLVPRLQSLYRAARFSSRSSDYKGVDIWRYFKNYLMYDLDSHYQNHLVILTDGYFDLESYRYTDQRNNRFTSTKFFADLDDKSWRMQAENDDYGLIPVKTAFPDTRLWVVGIQPKSKKLNEIDKLHYFWGKWLKESGYARFHIINNNNANKIKQILQNKEI